jgi:uncharacterized protein involved in exopolysaccharide biosynthesis/Mrp family chromosome partitioning ATPase
MTISTFPPDRNLPLSAMHHESRFQIEAKSDELDLTSGLRLIRRRIAMILVLIALFMAAASWVIWDLKPAFRSESRLIIHKPLATTISAEDSGRNEPLDLRSEMERILSRSVAERVIHDMELDKRPEFNPALREVSFVDEARTMLRGLIDREKRAEPADGSVELIIPEYYRALRVWRDGLGDVIQIGFDAIDPLLAAAVPNRLIGVYLEERNESIRRRLDAAEDWIRQRIDEQQGRADAARGAADAYRETAVAVLVEKIPGEQLKSLTELTERQGKIAQNRAETLAAIATLRTADDMSLALNNIALPASIAAMVENVRGQQRDLDRLLEAYDSKAQAVTDLRTSIVKSRTDLRFAVDRYLQSLRAKLAAFDQESADIRSELRAADEKRSRAALAQAELTRLERIADREQTALDKLEEQRRGLAGQAMLPGTEVEVLSPAAVPIGPQGRGRLFYLISALVASATIAVTAAFVAEMLDKKVRSFDQLAGITRMVPAGFLPRLKNRSWRRRLWPFGQTQDDAFDDAIRGIITSLRHSNGGKLPASILLTSAGKGAGKSLVARSLAVELVANGHPVLLVDGNLQGGNRNSFFKSELKQGLNEFLRGQARIEDIIHHHPRTGLDFIQAGKPDARRRVRLSGLADIIEMARARGQIVIFESAPASRSADMLQLAALMERTLMVVRWARTSRHAIETSVRQSRGSRSTDILIAINGVNAKRHALYGFKDAELFPGTDI